LSALKLLYKGHSCERLKTPKKRPLVDCRPFLKADISISVAGFFEMLDIQIMMQENKK